MHGRLGRGVAVLLTLAGLAAGCHRASPRDDADPYPGRRPLLTEAPTRFPSDPPPTPPSSAAPAPCPASGVRVETGKADAATGLRALPVYLVNCGRATYRVSGYPRVQALDDQRKHLAVQVLRGVTEITGPLPDWSGPAREVTLKPGQRAVAVVAWRNTYDDIRQPPVTAAYLSIAPAAGRPAQVVAPAGGLDLGSTGRLGVSPWRVPART